MKTLGIDTATNICSVALVEDENILGGFSINAGNLHDQKLITMVSNLLDACNLSLEKVDIFAVSIGPGSFTGLRIGLSAAKGLAISMNKQIIGISSLDAIAYRYFLCNSFAFQYTIVSVLDAKRDDIYYAMYTYDRTSAGLKRKTEYKCESLVDFKKIEQPVIFIGENILKIQNAFKNQNYIYDFSELSFTDAKYIALLANKRAKISDFDNIEKLEPIYIREFIPVIKNKEI